MSWHIVSAFELKVFLFLVGAYIGTFADLGMFGCFLCGINLNYLFSKVTHSTVVSLHHGSNPGDRIRISPI
jgi:hypothetical protein